MAYDRKKWIDEAVERPRTFRDVVNPDGSRTFTKEPGIVYQQGTPMNAANFNHLEEGLQQLSVAHDLQSVTTEALLRELLARLDAHVAWANGDKAAQDTKLNSLEQNKAQKPIDFTVNAPVSGWSASAPYTQTLTVTGMLASDKPIVDYVPNSSSATRIKELESFAFISRLQTANNSITITCDSDKPTTLLVLALRVVR